MAAVAMVAVVTMTAVTVMASTIMAAAVTETATAQMTAVEGTWWLGHCSRTQLQYIKQNILFWNSMSYPTYIGIQN